MAKGKDMSGDDGKQVRGKSGPDSSTANEKKQARKGKASGSKKSLPKTGKHDSGKSDSYGGNLH